MKKIIGYLLAGVGLLVLAGNSKVARAQIPLLAGIDVQYLMVGGLALVCLGVVVLIVFGGNRGKVGHITDEVPIYQGEGRKRKIVGYRTK